MITFDCRSRAARWALGAGTVLCSLVSSASQCAADDPPRAPGAAYVVPCRQPLDAYDVRIAREVVGLSPDQEAFAYRELERHLARQRESIEPQLLALQREGASLKTLDWQHDERGIEAMEAFGSAGADLDARLVADDATYWDAIADSLDESQSRRLGVASAIIDRARIVKRFPGVSAADLDPVSSLLAAARGGAVSIPGVVDALADVLAEHDLATLTLLGERMRAERQASLPVKLSRLRYLDQIEVAPESAPAAVDRYYAEKAEARRAIVAVVRRHAETNARFFDAASPHVDPTIIASARRRWTSDCYPSIDPDPFDPRRILRAIRNDGSLTVAGAALVDDVWMFAEPNSEGINARMRRERLEWLLHSKLILGLQSREFLEHARVLREFDEQRSIVRATAIQLLEAAEDEHDRALIAAAIEADDAALARRLSERAVICEDADWPPPLEPMATTRLLVRARSLDFPRDVEGTRRRLALQSALLELNRAGSFGAVPAELEGDVEIATTPGGR